MIEQWKPITGHDYEISDEGRVKSLKFGKIRMLTINHTAPGHAYVYLCFDGTQKCYYVSTLVLEAFVSARPPGFVSVHIDGNTFNNSSPNLRWVSWHENYNLGGAPEARKEQLGGNNPNSFLNEKEVLEIREKHQQGETYEELAIEYLVQTLTIARIIRRESWIHI